MGQNKDTKISRNNLKVKVPENHKWDIETPLELPKLHTLQIYVGHRGSGKSIAATNMLDFYRQNGLLDRLIIISPTYYSNRDMLGRLNEYIFEDDVLDPEDNSVGKTVAKKIEEERDDYERYWEDLKWWKKMMKQEEDHIDELMQDEERVLRMFDGKNFQKPTHWLNGKRPVIHVYCDDCQDTQLFRNRHFKNLCIRHRHIGPFMNEPGALGASLYLTAQNYKSTDAGLPKPLRGNCTVLCVFFSNNRDMLDNIAKEANGEIDDEEFYAKYRKATNEAHSFLMIDFTARDKRLAFRKRFEEPV